MIKNKLIIYLVLGALIIISITMIVVIYIKSIKDSEIIDKAGISLKKIDQKVPDLVGLEGAYSPKIELIINDFTIECFKVQLQEDKTRVNSITFLLKKIDDVKYMNFCRSDYFNIDQKYIKAIANNTPLGTIKFEGEFLPVDDGDYWLVPYDEPVVKGGLLIISENKVLYEKKDQEFTFLIGE
ncbi:MAG: hypothetical protein ACM3ZC_05395 [Bacteroidota bacterium]